MKNSEIQHYLLSIAEAGEGGRLPRIVDIAAYLGVSRNCVRQAALRLREKGALDFSRGRPLRKRLLNTTSVQPSPPRRIADTLYRELREAILFGDFRSEPQLPKIGALARERHISDHTVRAAYAQLVHERLIYRSGKAFFAGRPAPAARRVHIRGLPSEILILHPKENQWAALMRSERTMDFVRIFNEEAGQFGIQLTPVFTDAVSHQSFLCCGRLAIARYINGLGHRYCGTLIIGESYDFHRPPGKTNLLLEYIPWLCRFKRPVIWFDSINNLTATTVHPIFKESYRVLVQQSETKKRFVRCYIDEDSAVKKAVETLWYCGHRRFGIANCNPSYTKWAASRMRKIDNVLKALAAGGFYSLRTYNAAPEKDASEMPATSQAGRDEGSLLLLGELFEQWRRESGAKALIAPNDTLARLYYLALKYRQWRIPEDFSIMSFDANAARLYPWPITSIDFGFQYLGFCAFRRIIQDLPLEKGVREMPSQSRINHRGTVGPALGHAVS